MATQVSIGHNVDLAILYLDQHGNPMLEAPKADSAPTWVQTNPNAEALVVASDGLTAQARPQQAGTDTIRLSVTVGGRAFETTIDVNVIAEAQTLTSVAIDAKVS